MSALTAQTTQSSLEEERRSHEPSMEEILASIRRIIADEDSVAASRRERIEPNIASLPTQRDAAPAPVASSAPEQPVAEELAEAYEAGGYYVAETTEPHEAVEAATYQEETDDSEPRDSFQREESDRFHERESFFDERQVYAEAEKPTPLVSPDAAASITAQFQTLAASMLINDSGLLHEYARELLRPMLKAWLDDNLPVLVERLVRAEIERVARGGAKR